MQPDSLSKQLALGIVRQLQAAGHVAYFAGGCVRDQLLGNPPKDYDVATSATPDQVLTLFPRAQKVGAAFGVILVKQKNAHVEVATFRTDGTYSDGRRPDSVRFATAPEDAQRRDFTCNGLFFDPIANNGGGELHDYVNGQPDIHAKLLRAIGNPDHRFTEDHLRLLRAIRFAARLNFQIEKETHAAITRMQSNIASISRERIGEEIRMMLEHPSRLRAMELLTTFPILFTEVFGLPSETLPMSSNILAALVGDVSRTLALAAILSDCYGELNAWPQDSVATLRAKVMLSNEETETLTWLSQALPQLERWENLTKAQTKRMMASPHWHDLESLFRADPDNANQILAFNERLANLKDETIAPPPFITGQQLIALGAQPGRSFKKWLDDLYDRQLEGDLKTREEAEAAARKLIQLG